MAAGNGSEVAQHALCMKGWCLYILQKDQEALMIVKTPSDRHRELQNWLQRHHPYEVPEILALNVSAGSADYMNWVFNETENL